MESVNLDMDDIFDSEGAGGALEEDFDQPQHTMAELDGEAEEAPMRPGAGGDDDEGRVHKLLKDSWVNSFLLTHEKTEVCGRKSVGQYRHRFYIITNSSQGHSLKI